ncbi:uncharacterized protein LOC135481359 [Liolophura sinensis]|uniref:uncharacterized protein LOC135481359 n=1 Tax=Liolophura sinensis TaxID=3198878 RepID=UPI0031596833
MAVTLTDSRFHERIIEEVKAEILPKIAPKSILDHMGSLISVEDKQRITQKCNTGCEIEGARELMDVLHRLFSDAFVKFVEAVKLTGAGDSGKLLAGELYRRVPDEYKKKFDHIFQEEGDGNNCGSHQYSSSGMKMLEELPSGKVKTLSKILDENGEWEELVPDEKPLSEVNRMKESRSPSRELLSMLVRDGWTEQRFVEHMKNKLSDEVYSKVCHTADWSYLPCKGNPRWIVSALFCSHKTLYYLCSW